MPEVALVRYTDDPITVKSIVRRWKDYPPCLDTPDGGRAVSPVGPEHLGIEKGNLRFVEVIRENWKRPGTQFDKTDEVITIGPTSITGIRVWTAWGNASSNALIAARKKAQIDEYLAQPSTTIDFQVAKIANGGNLTKAQFVAFVNKNWPDPVLEP